MEQERKASLLQSKRDATKYQILLQIARHQPAISQQEIADALGITSQAVSNYLQELRDADHVAQHGRGRYEITNEGVNWLLARTDDLRALVQHVSEEVLGEVDIESALAVRDIEENERVSLTMRDGFLHATPDEDGDTGDGAEPRDGEPADPDEASGATAVAVSEAKAGQEVGVTDFEGVVDYEFGTVTVVSVPPVRTGGSKGIDTEILSAHAADADLLAVAGVEAIAAVRETDLSPDIRFGTPEAVQEAATRGLDVLLLAVSDRLSAHTDRLRENNVDYEVLDMRAEDSRV